jgi:chitinase
MDEGNKGTRKALYPPLGFLGIADWAVDLQANDDGADDDGSSSETIYINPDIWNSETLSLTGPPSAILIWPPMPLSSTATITFPLWTMTISYSSLTAHTKTLSDGSTPTGPWYIYESWLTVIMIPPGKFPYPITSKTEVLLTWRPFYQ